MNKRTLISFFTFLIVCLSSYSQDANHFEFTLNSPVFTQGTSNLAVNIEFPNVRIWGWLEVTITSSFSSQLATGKLTKRYQIGHNVGSGGYFNQATEIPEAFGAVAAQWYIGDFNHETNSIPIYHLVNTSNALTIKIEGMMLYPDEINSLKTSTTVSSLVTAVAPGGRQYMSIMQDRVGIGTMTPDTALAVNGTIHSKEVKVDMSSWPDYVFRKEYELPTLQEVEKHINEKGYLKNIPSEEEALKNGVSLGEMNAKLLEKIEELTLYVIKQSKEIDLLKREKNSDVAINVKIKELQNEINKLKNK